MSADASVSVEPWELQPSWIEPPWQQRVFWSVRVTRRKGEDMGRWVWQWRPEKNLGEECSGLWGCYGGRDANDLPSILPQAGRCCVSQSASPCQNRSICRERLVELVDLKGTHLGSIEELALQSYSCLTLGMHMFALLEAALSFVFLFSLTVYPSFF